MKFITLVIAGLFLSFIFIGATTVNAQMQVPVLTGVMQNLDANDPGAIVRLKGDGSGYNLSHEYSVVAPFYGANPNGTLVQGSNGKLYGMTPNGGSFNGGVIFSVDPANPASYTVIYQFDGSAYGNGTLPYGSLIQGADGKLYGMASQGGSNGAGVIFNIDTTSSPTYTVLYNFDFSNPASAGYPYGSLNLSGGLMYGTVASGGANYAGIIFSFDPSTSTFTDLYDFDGLTNYSPASDLLNIGGLLYGTVNGGNLFNGQIYSIDPLAATPSSSYTDVWDFDGVTGGGYLANNDLVAIGDTIYGMTNGGGANAAGVIFSYNLGTSTYTDLYDFNANTPGLPLAAFPTQSLVPVGNLLYAMTNGGGTNGVGAIFSIDRTATTPSATYNNLVSFTGNAGAYTGASPIGSLMRATDGKFYGLTAYGGQSGSGVMFSYNLTGATYTTLLQFNQTPNGANPTGSLLMASNGKLYGMTTSGGASNNGVIFSMDTTSVSPAYTALLSFSGNTGSFPGAQPYGSLIEVSGKLYGTTYGGGVNGFGVIFSYDLTANTYTDLYDFNGTSIAYSGWTGTGVHPSGTLLYANDNWLYGMTNGGGDSAYGVMFKINPAAGTPATTYTPLLSFTGLSGAYKGGTAFYGSLLYPPYPLPAPPVSNPHYSLIQAIDGNLYGMTESGGANNFGVLFTYNLSNSVYYPYVEFNDQYAPVGAFPTGGLVQAFDGKLYGMTSEGSLNGYASFGPYGWGVLFSLDPAAAPSGGANIGAYLDLAEFNNTSAPQGNTPGGTLIQASDSLLYGSVAGGGTNGGGVIFKYDYNASTPSGGALHGAFTAIKELGPSDGTNGGFGNGTLTEIPQPALVPTVCTWLGSTSSNWWTASNWSNDSVPNSCAASVVIPSGTPHDPVVNSAASAGTVQLTGNVSLTLNANLSVCGNWSSTGNAVVTGDNSLILNGTSAQTISGHTQFNILQINNTSGPGVSLQNSSSIVVIDSVLQLAAGSFNPNSGTVTLKSTSSNSAAYIDDFSAGFAGTYFGVISAQRHFDASLFNHQHLIGSPVSNPSMAQLTATGSAGYVTDATCDETKTDIGSPYGNIFSYNEGHGNTCAIQSWRVETSGALQNAQGYSYLQIGAGTISLTGFPNLNASYTFSSVLNGGISSSLTNGNYSNLSLQNRTMYSGYNLASNPYPATLSISSASQTAAVAAGFGAFVYVFETEGANEGKYTATTTVAPFQAFMVNRTASGTGGTYTINGSDRVTTSATFYKTAANNQLNIIATNTATGLVDNTSVAFNSSGTAQYDPMYDAYKIPGSLNRHTMFTLMGERWMEINTLNSIEETGTVGLGIEPGVSGTYTFSFNGVNSFDPTTYIMLEDLQTGTMYNVRNGAYTFTAKNDDNWNRFVLHFTPAAIIHATAATCSQQGLINITQPGTANWNYTLADNNNTIIASGTLNAGLPVISSVPAGVYTVTLVDNNGYTVVKNIQVTGAETVTASFNASATSVTQNDEINFTATTNNAISYSWNFGDGITATGTNATHTYQEVGVYNVTFIASNTAGCSSTATKTISVSSRSITAINNISYSNNIAIWSNDNKVYVDFAQISHVQATVTIYNIIGQQMFQDKISTNGIFTKEIDNIEAGYLVVNVKNGDSVITRKVFIANSK